MSGTWEIEDWAVEYEKLERRLARVRMAGLKAQDEWEGWITSELEGSSMFNDAMKDAKTNRRRLEGQS